jgi:hypothetical protein
MLKLSEKIEGVSEGRSKSIAMLILGPILGLIYFVSLPLIAIGAVAVMVGDRMVKGMVRLVSFGWRPQESYLGGKKKSKKEDKK